MELEMFAAIDWPLAGFVIVASLMMTVCVRVLVAFARKVHYKAFARK